MTRTKKGTCMTRRSTTAGLVGIAGALGLALSACGGSSTAASSNTPAAARTPGSSAPPTTLPGASGTIASVTPTSGGVTLEVQSASAQTTVNVSSGTRVIQTLTAAVSDVTAGTCVTVTGTPSSGGILANTVAITPAANGACGPGAGGGLFRGGPGGRRQGTTNTTGGTLPNRARAANVSIASGKVSTTSASGFQLQGDMFTPGTGRPPTGTGSTTTPTTTLVTVATSSATRFTKTVQADASAAQVNLCANARGPADSTGAISAQTLVISQPGPNGCNTVAGGGFGRFGGGAGGAGSAGPGGATT